MSTIKHTLLIVLVFACIGACSIPKQSRDLLPYLNIIEASSQYIDSLSLSGVDTILLYHKKHGYDREYFVLWLEKSELQIRNIRKTGILEISDCHTNGYYRDIRIFDFYQKHKKQIENDSIDFRIRHIKEGEVIYQELPSHYPYVEIFMIVGKETKKYHLPYGINYSSDNVSYHLARLIESTIYNLIENCNWIEAEKKFRYYPKRFNPEKEKWQDWKRIKIRDGEIWDDSYH